MESGEVEIMQHSDITEKVIAAAYAVHNAMGFGYCEDVYAKCNWSTI